MLPINQQFVDTSSSSSSSSAPTQLGKRKRDKENATTKTTFVATRGIDAFLEYARARKWLDKPEKKPLNFSLIPERPITVKDIPTPFLSTIGAFLGNHKNSGIVEFFATIPKRTSEAMPIPTTEHTREAVLLETLKTDGRFIGTILKNAGNDLNAIRPYWRGMLTQIRNDVRSLDLSNNSNLTDAELQTIVQFFPNLTKLNLFKCEKITDDGLHHLATLTQLQHLNLNYCYQITDAGLQHLSALTELKTLLIVNRSSIDKVKDYLTSINPSLKII